LPIPRDVPGSKAAGDRASNELHYAVMLSIAIAVGAFLPTKGFRKNY
jgi:hypothetical protein